MRCAIRAGALWRRCSRTAEELEKTRSEIEAHGGALAVVADVSSASDLEDWHRRTIDRFGQVDILVTNTGGPPVKRFMDLSDESWLSGVESTLPPGGV